MRTIAIALFLAAAIPSSARSDCPINHVSAGSTGHALQYDLTTPEGNFDGTPVTSGGPCTACYSWPLGYFRASGYNYGDWFSSVEAQDQFQLVGPASATPLTFSVRLRVSGSVQTYGQGTAGLGEGSSATQVLNVTGGQSPSNAPVALSLQHLPGEPFDIHVSLGVGSVYPYTSADLLAFFEFVDVPKGWSIVSCQGFDVPVPSLRTTWGRLRAVYR